MSFSSFIKGLLIAFAIAILFAIYVLFQLVFDSSPLNDKLLYVASFGCFGLLIGGILVFDKDSKSKGQDHPLARIGLGVTAGLGLAFLWKWPIEAKYFCALIGGGLGYFGLLWAKYIDF